MIGMKVRGQKVVDVIGTGGVDGRHDAIRIAPVARAVSRVDQHRFAGRCDHQRGLAAFDVDEIDVESAGALQGTGREGDGEERREAHANHAPAFFVTTMFSTNVPLPSAGTTTSAVISSPAFSPFRLCALWTA